MHTVVLNILQFAFTVLLIPVITTVTKVFLKELSLLGYVQELFLWGMLGYTLLQLFYYSPQGIYQFFQKIFADIFKSMPVLAEVIPLFLPVLPMLLLVSIYICVNLLGWSRAEPYLIFFAGFSMAMHLILSAHVEFDEDNSTFKIHYLFLMSLTFVIAILITGILFSLCYPRFSFGNFFMAAYDGSVEIYKAVFHQLFR